MLSKPQVCSLLLFIYLLIVGILPAACVLTNFPDVIRDKDQKEYVVFAQGTRECPRFWPFGQLHSVDQGLVLLALMAGMVGSFLHAAQSLTTYLGNDEFKTSWAAWYLMRPWIGAVLGMTIYVVLRAGLVGGTTAMNPYGVVAVALLGGWFAKTTTDKLQEVFDTLFKTREDEKRKDKLTSG